MDLLFKMHCGGSIAAVMVVLLVVQQTEAVPCCARRERTQVSVAGSLAIAGSLPASLGHGRPSYGRGCTVFRGCRWRRSLDDFLKDARIQETYSKIAAEDRDQCGLRLVCELAQKDLQDLAQDEIQILNPYRGAGESDGTIYGNYDEAAWHGKEGHGCSSQYQRCAYTAEEVMAEYRKYSK